jgi:hypothetical protein
MLSRGSWWIVAALLSAYLLQCAWSAYSQSIVFDETFHLSAGIDKWRSQRFDEAVDAAPLAQLLVTLPVIGNKFQIDVQYPNQWPTVVLIRPDPRRFVAGPRAVNIILGLILGIFVWCAARRFFSPMAAHFALALFAFSPPVIAHFSVATVDGVSALMIFALAFQVVRWRGNPTWAQTRLTGLVLGLTLLAKFYTPPHVALALVLMLLTARASKPATVRPSTPKAGVPGTPEPPRFTLRPRAWSWKPALAALGIACLVVWAGYSFHVGHVFRYEGKLILAYPHGVSVLDTDRRWNLDFWIPAPEYFAGLNEVAIHNELGHPAFFLGRVYRHWIPHTYFPVVIALKWPAIPLLLGLAGLALVLWRGAPGMRPGGKRKLEATSADTWVLDLTEFLVFGSFGAITLLLAIWSHIGIGDRHVLPAYPFLLLSAAAVWEWTANAGARRTLGLAALILLAALNAADALRYAPGYLSYFNVLVSPSRSYRLLTDSNLDWGQGLWKLREYQQQHPGETIHLAYFGSVDPAIYGIQAEPLRPQERVTGTVVVSATAITGQLLRDSSSYRWLLQYPPKAILDHCLFVFEVPKS